MEYVNSNPQGFFCHLKARSMFDTCTDDVKDISNSNTCAWDDLCVHHVNVCVCIEVLQNACYDSFWNTKTIRMVEKDPIEILRAKKNDPQNQGLGRGRTKPCL